MIALRLLFVLIALLIVIFMGIVVYEVWDFFLHGDNWK